MIKINPIIWNLELKLVNLFPSILENSKYTLITESLENKIKKEIKNKVYFKEETEIPSIINKLEEELISQIQNREDGEYSIKISIITEKESEVINKILNKENYSVYPSTSPLRIYFGKKNR